MSRRNTRSQPLEGKPLIRLKLIRDLALSGETHDKLAEKYNVRREAISRFRKRNEDQIADCLEKAGSEFAGVLISDKATRLSVYEDLLSAAVAKGDRTAAVRILRNVAEELGHLPSRMQISGAVDVHTTYSVTGPDGAPVDMGGLT